MRLELPQGLRRALPPGDAFDAVMALPGELYRQAPGRATLGVSLAGQAYVLKRHFGVGWAEIFKNLLSARLPVVSAAPEVHALRTLRRLGIRVPALVGHGQRGVNPAHRQSFVLMQALYGMTTLEDLCRDWSRVPPTYGLRRGLTLAVADIARRLHEGGCNHRDFYLCHFLLDGLPAPGSAPAVYLIDLHRVQQRPRVPRRWRIKDLGGLYFSALDAGLSRRDCLRFVRAYRGARWRQELRRRDRLWVAVHHKAVVLYRKAHGKPPSLAVRP